MPSSLSEASMCKPSVDTLSSLSSSMNVTCCSTFCLCEDGDSRTKSTVYLGCHRLLTTTSFDLTLTPTHRYSCSPMAWCFCPHHPWWFLQRLASVPPLSHIINIAIDTVHSAVVCQKTFAMSSSTSISFLRKLTTVGISRNQIGKFLSWLSDWHLFVDSNLVMFMSQHLRLKIQTHLSSILSSCLWKGGSISLVRSLGEQVGEPEGEEPLYPGLYRAMYTFIQRVLQRLCWWRTRLCMLLGGVGAQNSTGD